MGTETLLIICHLSKRLSYHVKLNNPLMGTETLKAIAHFLATCVHVKLNNPLMGTDTIVWIVFLRSTRGNLGKLNNPHKGTEARGIYDNLCSKH